MKECPICHARSFDDMKICYGCLHEFSKEENMVQERQSFPEELSNAKQHNEEKLLLNEIVQQQEDPFDDPDLPFGATGFSMESYTAGVLSCTGTAEVAVSNAEEQVEANTKNPRGDQIFGEVLPVFDVCTEVFPTEFDTAISALEPGGVKQAGNLKRAESEQTAEQKTMEARTMNDVHTTKTAKDIQIDTIYRSLVNYARELLIMANNLQTEKAAQ